MGKKKIPMKTKNLSIAIAESSSVIGDVQVEQQHAQQVTPRKRGRPRKVVEKSEDEDEYIEEERHQDLQENMESKKAKTAEDLVKEETSSPATTTIANKNQPRRSRRKSKPRKSC
ncbi:hypothetical protein Tco_1370462 [Tanacetum coccineum]